MGPVPDIGKKHIYVILAVFVLCSAAIFVFAGHGTGDTLPSGELHHFLQQIVKNDAKISIDLNNNGVVDEIDKCVGSPCNTNGIISAGDIDMSGNKVTNSLAPTDMHDAATKAYVDAEIARICVSTAGTPCVLASCTGTPIYNCRGTCVCIT